VDGGRAQLGENGGGGRAGEPGLYCGGVGDDLAGATGRYVASLSGHGVEGVCGRFQRARMVERRRCLRRNQPGPYQIQAAINAVHSDAPAAAATDWWQIRQLYDQLLSLAPSPVVALNRAVAVAEVEGPDAALTLVDGLDLDGYHLFHAIRADLLRRLGRNAEAALAYEAAIARAENATERDFLRRGRAALGET
jgi:RNA polymerase sigma-70 factor (ECF subfamily)